MNKKEYLNPTTDVVRVETVGMIAGSVDMEVYQEEEITSADAILSRQGGGFWDDED